MRSLTGTFGPTQIAVPRARIIGEDGKTAEWKSKSLRAYQRRTKQAEALIAGAYPGGMIALILFVLDILASPLLQGRTEPFARRR
jgi:hypothetical protein